MRILAVDTCLGACSVAVCDGDTILAHRCEAMERGHAEALAPMVQAAMADAKRAFHDLDRLAVTVGPGTFTGQRVGLAFMRGLKTAREKPLIGVTSLEAMALAAQTRTGNDKVAVLHDARRGEAYLLLRAENRVVLEPSVMAFALAQQRVADFGPCMLAGTGAAAVAEALGADFATSTITAPDALFVAHLARDRPVPAEAPAPLYLRAPDAKLPGGREAVQLFDAGGDIAALARVHAAAFEKSWDEAALISLFAAPGVFAFTAFSGFVLAREAGGEAEILTLAVAPAARCRGLGGTLMRAAAAHAQGLGAQTLFLEVGTDNPAALALYAGLGFQRAGARKGYYDGGDAFILKAALPLAGKFA